MTELTLMNIKESHSTIISKVGLLKKFTSYFLIYGITLNSLTLHSITYGLSSDGSQASLSTIESNNKKNIDILNPRINQKINSRINQKMNPRINQRSIAENLTQQQNQIVSSGLNTTESVIIEKSCINYSDDSENLDTESLDPFKKLNILSFYFNGILDYLILSPITKIYKNVTNEDFKAGVHNVLDNYKAPISSFNSVLQGEFADAAIHFWRFTLNFTLGGFGLNDVSTKLGLPKIKHRNFGSTLASYGVGPGAYIMLPLYGPTTARDMFDSIFLNQKTNFINHEIPSSAQKGLAITYAVHNRYLAMKHSGNMAASIPDIYKLIRDMYLTRRESEVEYPEWCIYKRSKKK